MANGTLTVLGGSGFVGRTLLDTLSERGWRLRVLTRNRARAASRPISSEVELVECDVHDAAALAVQVQGSTAVINLVGILNATGNRSEDDFEGAHTQLTEKVVQACLHQGVRRYLHMSALGVDAERGTSRYLRSKGKAEQHVEAAADQLDYTIFRPSIIFGPDDDFFNRFAQLLKFAPLLPLACPHSSFSPVYVGDVARAFADALEDEDTIGKTLSLCGPRDYTLRELVQYTAEVSGHTRPIINLPDVAARLQARVMEWVPGKPFTRDNYGSLQTPNTCPPGCPRQATSLESIVPGYLG